MYEILRCRDEAGVAFVSRHHPDLQEGVPGHTRHRIAQLEVPSQQDTQTVSAVRRVCAQLWREVHHQQQQVTFIHQPELSGQTYRHAEHAGRSPLHSHSGGEILTLSTIVP